MCNVACNTLVRITDRIRFNFFDCSLNRYLTEFNVITITIIIYVIIITTIIMNAVGLTTTNGGRRTLNVKQNYENTVNNKFFLIGRHRYYGIHTKIKCN